MSRVTFEPTRIEPGVLVLESLDPNDWSGFVLGSVEATNTPEVCWEWPRRLAPASDIEATLREATERYDGLLRRLAD